MSRPTTLGALKREIAAGRVARRPVRSELRENLLARLKSGGPIFPGVLGYDDTVQTAIDAGISGIIQPGGSKRDDEITQLADDAGIFMVFTGRRHFRH